MPDHDRFLSTAARGPLDAERARLIETFARETATTLRVVRAFPPDALESRPHPRSMTARELMWLFTMELTVCVRALMGAEKLFDGQAAPDTLDAIATAFDKARGELLALLRSCDDDDLAGTVSFPVAPGKLADWPRTDFLWLMLHDQIHHRGQLSVYLRMAGGRLPSIYGPTADEPWS